LKSTIVKATIEVLRNKFAPVLTNLPTSVAMNYNQGKPYIPYTVTSKDDDVTVSINCQKMHRLL